MFCYQCGQPIPTGGRFCPHCGTAVAPSATAQPAAAVVPNAPAAPPLAPPPPPGAVTYHLPPAGTPPPDPGAYAPPAYTPPAYAQPAYPPPAYPPPPPSPSAPPVAYAPATTERLIYWENAVRTKAPGRAFWNHDILITERRLIARKTGWMGNFAKGMAHAAAGGLVNALAATALYSLQSGMHAVKTPRFPGPEVAIGEIDAFLGDRDGVVEFRFDQLSSWTFRRRRLIVPPTSVLQGAPGELQTEINFHKELLPIMRQILGARVQED